MITTTFTVSVAPLKMTDRILLCTDLDRTLLPNGAAVESPSARERFALMAGRPEVRLAYVTGRHRALVLDAIAEYALPYPQYVIGDVGTSIYDVDHSQWRAWPEWQQEIAADWDTMRADDLAELYIDIEALTLQEPQKQNQYKLSYYTPVDIDSKQLIREMQGRLKRTKIRASFIWSLDEQRQRGLLDVLPPQATKRHAIDFLMGREGFQHRNTVFAGDSGNDLPVLVSPIQSVLVANALPAVREEAQRLAQQAGTADALYLAQGGFLGMNGNYSAGILEGLTHYLPRTAHWYPQE